MNLNDIINDYSLIDVLNKIANNQITNDKAQAEYEKLVTENTKALANIQIDGTTLAITCKKDTTGQQPSGPDVVPGTPDTTPKPEPLPTPTPVDPILENFFAKTNIFTYYDRISNETNKVNDIKSLKALFNGENSQFPEIGQVLTSTSKTPTDQEIKDYINALNKPNLFPGDPSQYPEWTLPNSGNGTFTITSETTNSITLTFSEKIITIDEAIAAFTKYTEIANELETNPTIIEQSKKDLENSIKQIKSNLKTTDTTLTITLTPKTAA